MSVFSVIKEGRKLARQGYKKTDDNYRKKQIRKITLLVLFQPQFAEKWFKILHSEFFKPILPHRPRLYLKPFRVYMSINWKKKQRLKVIMDSYRFISQEKSELMRFVTASAPVTLSKFKLKDGETGKIQIWYENKFRKEGEFVLSLVLPHWGEPVFFGAIGFESLEKENYIGRIGCVQGNQYLDKKVEKIAQKLMFGLRPKSLILFAIQEFMSNLGIKKLYAVSQKIQVYRKRHLIFLPRFHEIDFDYNQFWKESGGQPAENGWYILPVATPRKKIKEIPSKKRSEYRKRYKMMDEIALEIKEKLQHLKK